jgi:hypothetical protein
MLREWQREVIQNAKAHHEERKDAIDRAYRAEAELGKLQELHGCSQGMVVHWCEHAAKRSLELDQVQAELATEREKAERYRLATLKLDAELATEREKVRTLRLACDQICEEWGINHDANPIGAGQRMSTRAGKALEATEDAT